MSDPRRVLPPGIPRRGSAAWQWIGGTVMRLAGWRFDGAFPDVTKLVIAVAPHTSNWDFLYGAAAMFAMDLKAAFIGKHTIFVWPVSSFLRWMGGIPVDRTSAHGVVEAAVNAFRESPSLVLAIAPEGTRKKVERFKTGFLHIARGAGVPVLLIGLDYSTRLVRIGPVIDVGEDIEAERARVEAHFARIPGKYPQ